MTWSLALTEPSGKESPATAKSMGKAGCLVEDWMAQIQCFVCHEEAFAERVGGRDAYFVECGVCGRYQITGTLIAIIQHPDHGPLLPYLSAAVRQATDEARDIELSTANWEAMARGHASTPASRKVRRLLEVLAAGSAFPGSWVQTNERGLAPRIDAGNEEEVTFLLNYLREAGYIDPQETMGPTQFRVTFRGWEALEPAGGGGVPGTCFVAMSFDPSLNAAFDEGITPAVETDCGVTVIRVDRVPRNESINDRIMAGVRAAQFVVADVTLQRQGVYFEAGFAMGLGRPVIWTCRQDDFEHVHFDTRPFNHVVWLESG